MVDWKKSEKQEEVRDKKISRTLPQYLFPLDHSHLLKFPDLSKITSLAGDQALNK
jgi:hypothetical protein